MPADQTKIEWTDFTVNFWEGCQKVGPGCDHCYAEARDTRFTGGRHWGPGAPRRKVKGGVPKIRKLQREAASFRAEHGHWPRVFCSSLSDIFDNAVDPSWRDEALSEVARAPDCRVQLLTKRIGNVEKMFGAMAMPWAAGSWPSHVGLMITVVNQQEADRDVPQLLDLKARLGIPWVGLSMEPLLGWVDLEEAWHGESALDPECWGECGWCSSGHPPLHNCQRGRQAESIAQSGHSGIDWIIAGGESGRGARPMHPDNVRTLRDQAVQAGVPFLFKQWGEWMPWEATGALPYWRNGAGREEDRHLLFPADFDADPNWDDGLDHVANGDPHAVYQRVGKVRAGRVLDGRTWDQMPEALE